MGRFDAVIFDLDGTLLDTSDGIIFTANETAKALGIPAVEDRNLFERHFIGPPLHRGFAEVFGLDGGILEKAVDAYIRLYPICGGAEMYGYYPGLVDAVHELKKAGFRIGVSTLKNEQVARRMLLGSEFGDVFDTIHGSDHTESLTKRDIIEMSLADLCVPRDRVLMVGDSESDLNGARIAGIPFLAVSWGFGFHSGYGAEDVAYTSGELTGYLL